jgi:uncharacterized protein with von Willebrand factor type A (vWA) domain
MTTAPSTLAAAFTRTLRDGGVNVPVSSMLLFADALGQVGLDGRDEVYWAGLATLVHRPEDRVPYDRAFRAFWELDPAVLEAAEPDRQRVTLALDDGTEDDTGDDGGEANDDPTITVRFSTHETLRHKDFSAYTSDELDEFHVLMSHLRLVGAPRSSRRLVSASRPTGRLDLRRTVRAALRSDGEAIQIRHRRTSTKPRRLVLVLDVSGSMEPYARALVRWAHAAVVGRRRVEVFALGTRLTRVTRELSSRDPDRALRQASLAVLDWSGGTRLGEGLRRFNDDWGQRGMARGAIVVVLSDGWDRGEPAVMA